MRSAIGFSSLLRLDSHRRIHAIGEIQRMHRNTAVEIRSIEILRSLPLSERHTGRNPQRQCHVIRVLAGRKAWPGGPCSADQPPRSPRAGSARRGRMPRCYPTSPRKKWRKIRKERLSQQNILESYSSCEHD